MGSATSAEMAGPAGDFRPTTVVQTERDDSGRLDILGLQGLRGTRAARSFYMTTPRKQGQAAGDTDTPRSDRVADAEAERGATRSPAQQAVINEEQAFESGEENPS